MSVMLSPHFSMAELTATQHRAWVEQNALYARERAGHLRWLCEELLEPVRETLGVPIIVNSGIRCPALNAAVGGSVSSAHLDGLAVDFIAPAFGAPYDVAQKLGTAMPARNIAFDQLIYEHTWVHVSIAKLDRARTGPGGQPTLVQRGQVLTLMPGGTYAPGIVLRG